MDDTGQETEPQGGLFLRRDVLNDFFAFPCLHLIMIPQFTSWESWRAKGIRHRKHRTHPNAEKKNDVVMYFSLYKPQFKKLVANFNFID